MMGKIGGPQSGEEYDGSYLETYDMRLRHGKGDQTYKDGSHYEGYWCENQIHYLGKLVFANGDVYEGCFDYGKLDGEDGTYTRYGDDEEYKGTWKDDKLLDKDGN